MKFCMKCGAQLRDGDRFCMQCGTKAPAPGAFPDGQPQMPPYYPPPYGSP